MCLLLSSPIHRPSHGSRICPFFHPMPSIILKMARWVITNEPCFAELPETGNPGQNLCRGFLNLQLPGSPVPSSVFGHPTNPRPSSIARLGYLVPRHGHPEDHHRSPHVIPPSPPAPSPLFLASTPSSSLVLMDPLPGITIPDFRTIWQPSRHAHLVPVHHFQEQPDTPSLPPFPRVPGGKDTRTADSSAHVAERAVILVAGTCLLHVLRVER